MTLLRGAALASRITTMVREHFAAVSGEGVRKPGKRGRPFTKTIQDVANDYLAPFPAELAASLQERPDLIEGFIDALVANRRSLSEEESNYILNGIDIVEGQDEEGNDIVKHYGGRDALAMGVLDGEPTQVDTFNRYSVQRKTGERLGYAVYRRFNEIKDFIQQEANRANKTLYIVVERYAIERNLRDEMTATKYRAPLSAVGLMSKNVVTIIVTDNLKDYKGFIAVLSVVSPGIATVKTKAEVTVEESLPVLA